MLEGPNRGYCLAVGGKGHPQKGEKIPKKGQELVRIPPPWEDDEKVAANVMWSVCLVPGKTSFTTEDDAVQALKKMNSGHEDKAVGQEDNANDKVTEAIEAKGKETVPDAKAKGGGDESNGDGIAQSSGAGDPSHGKGLMEPNSDGYGDAEKMDEPNPRPTRKWCVPTKRKASRKWMNPWKRESKEERQSPRRMSAASPPPTVTQVWLWPRGEER